LLLNRLQNGSFQNKIIFLEAMKNAMFWMPGLQVPKSYHHAGTRPENIVHDLPYKTTRWLWVFDGFICF